MKTCPIFKLSYALLFIISLLSFQNMYSQDKDLDTVADSIDLDDDNDGILDTVECGVPLLGNITSGIGTNSVAGSYEAGKMTTDFTVTSPSLVETTLGSPQAVAFNSHTTGVIQGLMLKWDEGRINPGSVFDMTLTLNNVQNGNIHTLKVANNADNSNYSAQNALKTITLSWPGGTSAVLHDPMNEITNLTDGSIINSGTTLEYNVVLQVKDSQWHLDIDLNGVTFPFDLDYHTVSSVLTRFEGFAFMPIGCLDTDNDTISNSFDLDSDNDGIPDTVETQLANMFNNPGSIDPVTGIPVVGSDTDGVDPIFSDNDTLPDYLDVDSDDDGISDAIEYGVDYSSIDYSTDTDSDGIPDGMDADFGGTDTNNNGIVDSFEPVDTDGDSIPDYLDLDSDNDGLYDVVEAGFSTWDTNSDGHISSNASTDLNDNGQVDATENRVVPNTVSATPMNYKNTDSDGDGCPDALEAAGSFTPSDLTADDSLSASVDNRGVPSNTPTGQPITNAVIDFLDASTCIAFIDTDNDGIIDALDLDDDNDGIPDVEEGLCSQINTFDVSAEGWYTINDNDNTLVQSNPASHSTENVTATTGCPINTSGAANATIAGSSPTGTNYIVDTDPNEGDNFLRSPNQGGVDLSNLLGGQVEYDAYDYKVGVSGNPGWVSNPMGNVYLYDTLGNFVQATFPITPAELTNWENGFWNTFKIPLDDASWSGTQADLISVLADYDYMSIQMEYVLASNTGDCATTEYYAIDNVGLSNLNGGATCDFDNDGIPNSLDLDSDNDGILDIYEAGGTDVNNDGLVDNFVDIDNDGLNDAQDNIDSGGTNEVSTGTPLTLPNTDGTGAPDFLDIDADDDGIVDNIEGQSTLAYQSPLNADDDQDGIDNQYDIDFAGNTAFNPENTDYDALDDYRDLDSDNDTISDTIEGWDIDADGTPETVFSNTDLDGDGLDDAYDTNTAVIDPTNGQVPTDFPDAQQPNGDRDWRQGLDTDFDGILDDIDLDDDNDGIPDTEEGTADTDGDGLPDYLDLDSDNDGVTDIIEAGGTDTNLDGQVDYQTPGNPTTMLDTNNDGLEDSVATSPLPNEDIDGDGIVNRLDLDSDNDGIYDVIEAGGIDTDGDGLADDDDNNVNNSLHNGIPTSAGGGTIPIDTGNDGSPDYLNLDSDEDGCSDANEAYARASADGDDGGQFGNGLPATTDTSGLVTDADYTTGLVVAVTDATDSTACSIFDADGDGVLDSQEILDGTDLTDPCDYVADNITEPQTGDWLLADCDGDGVINSQEITDGTNPEDPCDFNNANSTEPQTDPYNQADCDGDGVINGTEIADETDPNNPCDFIEENITLEPSGDWLTADCDGDTIPNGQENTDGTDPFEPCSSMGGTPPENSNCVSSIAVESDFIHPDLNNGIFQINNIELATENNVKIFNRWGVLVFETEGYDNGTNAFKGISYGRTTINQEEELPVGIYFYIIEYVEDGVSKTLNGFLYVNR